jgi:hypothetical protein
VAGETDGTVIRRKWSPLRLVKAGFLASVTAFIVSIVGAILGLVISTTTGYLFGEQWMGVAVILGALFWSGVSGTVVFGAILGISRLTKRHGGARL